MADGFDIREFTEFERNLLRLANEKMPKESKKFLKKEANKLKKKTLAKAKQKVDKNTGNYFKSIKTGKVYKFDGNLSCRTFSSSFHAHLIEYGHRIVDSEGNEHGFVEGKHIFEESEKEFENEYFADAQDFLDEVLEKGL